MKKLAALAAAGLLGAALVIPASSAVADGPECDFYNHCYGIVEHHEPAFDAVGQELWTDCLVLDPPTPGDFATHEMWIVFPDGDFIEAGYVKGAVAGGMTESHFRWFWADWNGSTFTSHYVDSAPILNHINFSMYRNSGGTWQVYVNGVLRGTTTSTYGNANVIMTGGETTEPKVYSHGKARYLQSRNAATKAWTWATWDFIGETPGVYDVTHPAYERMEQISLQNICDPLPGGPPGTLAAKAPSMSDVKQLALDVAKQNGDESPEAVELVATKRSAAQAHLKAGRVDSDQDVYLVQVKGAFVGHAVPRPKGHAAPKGDTLTVTVDAKTGQVTDWSLGASRNDLAKLGAVKKL
ncbi:hypothetical protein [Nonomuraea sp. NPDC023979]|uniref:hypothetical protein n=1 Tax=Nonomuraea sp. NPDC023979 TaxID=3154796 RepID=UPI0033D43B2B